MSEFKLTDLFTYKLHELSKLIDQKIDFGHIDGFDISYAEGRVLAVIGVFERLSVVKLAHQCNLDKSQASRATNALVQKGLVIKTKNTTDNRSFDVCLSSQGQVAYQAVIERIKARNALALSALDADEQSQLLALLNKIITQLST